MKWLKPTKKSVALFIVLVAIWMTYSFLSYFTGFNQLPQEYCPEKPGGICMTNRDYFFREVSGYLYVLMILSLMYFLASLINLYKRKQA